ncbi:MAG: hypothetical protein H0T92_20625 [Pyrinomonadaceae bacterium]|nr:hypothetical protein [Pyrinomonadaceae bacterium]
MKRGGGRGQTISPLVPSHSPLPPTLLAVDARDLSRPSPIETWNTTPS